MFGSRALSEAFAESLAVLFVVTFPVTILDFFGRAEVSATLKCS